GVPSPKSTVALARTLTTATGSSGAVAAGGGTVASLENGVHSDAGPPSWKEYSNVMTGEPWLSGGLASACWPTTHVSIAVTRVFTGRRVTASDAAPQKVSLSSRHPRYCTVTSLPYSAGLAIDVSHWPATTSVKAPPLIETWNFSAESGPATARSGPARRSN